MSFENQIKIVGSDPQDIRIFQEAVNKRLENIDKNSIDIIPKTIEQEELIETVT